MKNIKLPRADSRIREIGQPVPALAAAQSTTLPAVAKIEAEPELIASGD